MRSEKKTPFPKKNHAVSKKNPAVSKKKTPFPNSHRHSVDEGLVTLHKRDYKIIYKLQHLILISLNDFSFYTFVRVFLDDQERMQFKRAYPSPVILRYGNQSSRG